MSLGGETRFKLSRFFLTAGGKKTTSSSCELKMFRVTVAPAATADSKLARLYGPTQLIHEGSSFSRAVDESIEERSGVPMDSATSKDEFVKRLRKTIAEAFESSASFRSILVGRVWRGKTLRSRLLGSVSAFNWEFPSFNLLQHETVDR